MLILLFLSEGFRITKAANPNITEYQGDIRAHLIPNPVEHPEKNVIPDKLKELNEDKELIQYAIAKLTYAPQSNAGREILKNYGELRKRRRKEGASYLDTIYEGQEQFISKIKKRSSYLPLS